MHVEETLDGFVITEFLHKVFWAGACLTFEGGSWEFNDWCTSFEASLRIF